MDDKKIRRIIKEEITKTEVTNLVMSKISEKLDSSAFEKKIKKMVADVVSNVFKILWQRDSSWKNAVSR